MQSRRFVPRCAVNANLAPSSDSGRSRYQRPGLRNPWSGTLQQTTRRDPSTLALALLASLAITGEIARKGVPAPLQAGKRWVIERTQSWMSHVGKVRRRTERNSRMIDFYLLLAAAFVVTRCLIQRARSRYRWPDRPTTRRLK
ncbi:hypothetical protein BH20CHL3_BH20CHL3_11680 [soil metagenome]